MADRRDRASALADPPATAGLGESTQKKIAWRLLPLFALGYGVALMDRNNIGFAALQMNRDLHFTASIYGFGPGSFPSATPSLRSLPTWSYTASARDAGLLASCSPGD
jgi:hypothetical protein